MPKFCTMWNADKIRYLIGGRLDTWNFETPDHVDRDLILIRAHTDFGSIDRVDFASEGYPLEERQFAKPATTACAWKTPRS